MSARPRIAVVGAGASGLRTTLDSARAGLDVDLFSLTAARRGPTASAGRSLAASDDVDQHLADAVSAAGYRVDQPALRSMLASGPAVAEEIERLGVALDRGPDGALARHRGGGHRAPRLVTSGLATRARAVRALDDALRPLAARIRRFEGWEVVALVRDGQGAIAGLVAQDLRSMEVLGFAAAAVVLASGGFPALWASSTAAPSATGAATSAALRAGAHVAEAHRLERHPIALLRGDKALPLPLALLDLGAELWIPEDATEKRRGRDVPPRARRMVLDRAECAQVTPAEAARRVDRAIAEHDGVFDPITGGIDRCVYLDATHLDPRLARDRLGSSTDAIASAAGLDLLEAPVRVAPAVHATMGGLAVDLELSPSGELVRGSPRNLATAVPGLFAVGGAAAVFRGAERLPGHRLLASLHGGALAAESVAARVEGSGAIDAAREVDAAALGERDRWEALMSRDAEKGDDPRELLLQLGLALSSPDPASTDAIADLATRARSARCADRSPRCNRGATALRQLEDALLLAGLVLDARQRSPSSGPMLARLEGTAIEALDAPPHDARFLPAPPSTPAESGS